MVGTAGRDIVRWSQSLKTNPSSDWSLQLDSMKPESLVIVDQLRHGEYVPGPCTHRPSRYESYLYQKTLIQPARGVGVQGMNDDWSEVVTR